MQGRTRGGGRGAMPPSWRNRGGGKPSYGPPMRMRVWKSEEMAYKFEKIPTFYFEVGQIRCQIVKVGQIIFFFGQFGNKNRKF